MFTKLIIILAQLQPHLHLQTQVPVQMHIIPPILHKTPFKELRYILIIK